MGLSGPQQVLHSGSAATTGQRRHAAPFPGVVEETDSFGTSRDAVRVLLGEKNIEPEVEIIPVTEPRWRMREVRAAHAANIPLIHVEAGLRASTVADPFPEGASRCWCRVPAPSGPRVSPPAPYGGSRLTSMRLVTAATAMEAAPQRAALPFDRRALFSAGDAAERIVSMLAAPLTDAVAA